MDAQTAARFGSTESILTITLTGH